MMYIIADFKVQEKAKLNERLSAEVAAAQADPRTKTGMGVLLPVINLIASRWLFHSTFHSESPKKTIKCAGTNELRFPFILETPH